MPYYLLLPLVAAIVYALGSITIKRALGEGVGMGQSFHLSNLVLGATFLPLLLFGRGGTDWSQVWRPVAMGSTFFVGNWLTFSAIRRGDVSLVTPLMGTKVVFVAVAVVLLSGTPPSGALWFAACLTTLSIFVMGLADLKGGKHVAFTIGVALASAGIFGLSDVLVATWARDFGAMPFLVVGSATVSAWTLVMWAIQGRRPIFPKGAGAKAAWAGALLVAIQALVLSIALAFFDDATGTNIVYASRGLWVIALVVVFGRFLGNHEHRDTGRGFLWRIAGTVLLTAAIVIAVMERARVE
ncbi:MAG TPA: EamA family transporter [Bacteroidia bacterium]|nr:EamA family transporter [Bacteroidia bacterium]